MPLRPNGLQAYMLAKGSNHKRVDEAPTDIAQDNSRDNAVIVNGISCMSCHSAGMRTHEDQVRSHVEKNSGLFNSEDLERILGIYRGNGKLAEAFEKDRQRFLKAMREAGVKNHQGDIDPIRRLTDRFEKNVDLGQAATELGVDQKALLAQAQKNPELNALLSRMNVKGVSRSVFDEQYQRMRDLLNAGSAGPEVSVFEPTDTVEFVLKLSVPKEKSRIESRWIAPGGAIKSITQEADKAGEQSKRFSLSPAKGRQWAPGVYRLEIFVDGVKQKTARFEIE